MIRNNFKGKSIESRGECVNVGVMEGNIMRELLKTNANAAHFCDIIET